MYVIGVLYFVADVNNRRIILQERFTRYAYSVVTLHMVMVVHVTIHPEVITGT